MGILINTGFDVGSSSPIDSRTLKDTIDERDALLSEGKVYENLKVYCKDTQKEYRWTGTEWEIVAGGSGGDLTDYQEKTDNTLDTTNKTIVGAINEVKDSIITNYKDLTNKPSIEGVELDGNKSLSDLGITIYDDTEVKSDIDNLNEYKQNKTDNTLDTTDKTITGSINEVNGNLLDTVGFSADYKNIILNRKNGLNPYTIPISAIINNTSLAELKDVDSTDVGNGKTLIYDSSTQKHRYVDTVGTDEFVKMDSTTDAHYLADLIDKQTVVNDNGVLKVKKLDGQEVTIAEINYLKGLTMNVMDLVSAFANGGVKVLNTPLNTASELDTMDRTSFIEGISYIVYVLADETQAGAKTTYLCDKTTSTFFGNADSQRNFTTNPIDLANEVTGKLDNSHIDVDNLWTLLTINDTYKTLTTNNEIFGTHGAKAMYDELTTEIGAKANSTDLTTHKDNTDIHITSDERTKWNDTADKVDGAELVKKADIVTTTLDENATNDDIYGGKAIYDAIKNGAIGNSVLGKETVLYGSQINATGTFTLTDDVNNYDFIIINHSMGGTDNKQSVVLTKNEISICTDITHRFLCTYGDGNASFCVFGYFNGDKVIITNCTSEVITSIVGYKFGQITVENTITNPAVGKSYSTDEQLTGGTWIDGKPIYRIHVSFPAFEMKPNEWNIINSLSMPVIDEIINARAKRSEDNAIIPLAAMSVGTSIAVNPSTNFDISALILEYTKQ